MFARLAQQTQAMGMSLEDFLKAQGKTAEEMQEVYKKDALESIRAEFILSHLINEEKIEVEEKEIDEMIAGIGDEATKEQLDTPMQRIYIKSILAKNKLLTKLMEDVEDKKEKKEKTTKVKKESK